MNHEAAGASSLLQERYAYVRTLAEGATSVLHEAELVGTESRVALKILRPEFAHNQPVAAAYLRALQASLAARHEHICPVYEAGQTRDGTVFVAMDVLSGETLEKRLASLGGRMSVGRAAHIVGQLLEALQVAHASGVAHLRIKPEHVFLVHKGHDPDFVQLLDFAGNALHPPGAASSSMYAAPEQLSGGVIDTRSDVYAVGALLFHLTTGRPPFDTPDAIKAGGAASPRSVNPDLPEEFSDAIARAIQSDPVARFQSVAEFREAIAPFGVPLMVAPDPTSTTTSTALTAVSSTVGALRRPWVAAGAAAVVVALSVGIGVGMRGSCAGSSSDPDAAPIAVPIDAVPPDARTPDAGAIDSGVPDAAAPKVATLEIRITPKRARKRARLYINGKQIKAYNGKRRSFTLELPAGKPRKHKVKITARGYKPEIRSVSLPGNGILEVRLRKRRGSRPPCKGSFLECRNR